MTSSGLAVGQALFATKQPPGPKRHGVPDDGTQATFAGLGPEAGKQGLPVRVLRLREALAKLLI